jgi:NAD(P)-dependent dehydrogenase (short-subunit alcohol dehydrogenase family)
MIHRLASMLNPTDPQSFSERYQSNIPIGRYGTADEIANLVLFLCSDLASNITGAQYIADGGRTATGGSATNNLIR